MEQLTLYLEYHVWANNRVLEKLKEVPKEDWTQVVGGSFPTLRELYQHILGGDYRWLERWKGVPIAEIPSHFIVDDYESLIALWRPILDETLALGAAFLNGRAEQPINFITAKGLNVTQPFWQTLYQVVNHGTYHRGQVANALRVLGREAVGTDIFLFFREKA
jgi:uncharacterized damage-inducible protein DinB